MDYVGIATLVTALGAVVVSVVVALRGEHRNAQGLATAARVEEVHDLVNSQKDQLVAQLHEVRGELMKLRRFSDQQAEKIGLLEDALALALKPKPGGGD